VVIPEPTADGHVTVSETGNRVAFDASAGIPAMSFEEDDTVVLHDKHSEFDGETGTVTQVVETMFGEPNFTVSFDDGQEPGVPEDNLELVEDEQGDEDEEAADADDE
jgi:hypothetical protein